MADEVSQCRSCGARIIWVRTQATRIMPLDAEPVPDGNVIIVAGGITQVIGKEYLDSIKPGTPRYKSHFATCPNSAQHRRKIEGKSDG